MKIVVLSTLYCWFQELIDIKMAQCHRVVNGEYYFHAVRSKAMYTSKHLVLESTH